METARVAQIALVVSVVALGVTGWQAVTQHQQAATEHQQLTEARLEFAKSGPNYSGSASVILWNSKTGKWTWPAKNATVPYSQSVEPWEPSLFLTITNTGRSIGTINEVGLTVSSQQISSDSVNCSTPKNDSTCSLPVAIAPGDTDNFWFPLSPDMTRDITCNDTAAKDGISVYYKSADSQVGTIGTTTALPISGFCAKLPSKAPGT